jgi:hypothetical protein
MRLSDYLTAAPWYTGIVKFWAIITAHALLWAIVVSEAVLVHVSKETPMLRHRRWAWQMARVGIFLIAISYLISTITHSRAAGGVIRVAGLTLVFVGILAAIRLKISRMPPLAVIRSSTSGTRAVLIAMWWGAVVGASLFIVGGIVILITGDLSSGRLIGVTGAYIVILAPAVIYIGIDPVLSVYRSKGLITTALLGSLVIASGPLLALFIEYLASNGDDIIFTSQVSGWAEACEILLTTIAIIALTAFPHIMHSRLPWDGTSELTRRNLPSSLAGIAAIATGLYALLLHFSRGPLASVRLAPLTAAILFAVVLLMPPYRSVAIACWREGLWDVVFLRRWRAEHAEMIREIRSAIVRGWAQERITEERRVNKSPDSSKL